MTLSSQPSPSSSPSKIEGVRGEYDHLIAAERAGAPKGWGSMTDSRCCLSNGFHAPQSLCDSSPILEEQLSTLSPDTNDLLSSSIVKLFESKFSCSLVVL